jgi:SLOG family YspA-like protein
VKLLVCGGRDFSDYLRVVHELDRINEECGGLECLIEGEARGVDSLAACWAYCRGVHIKGFRAEWARYGKAAGAIRNALMLENGKPDLVVAFAGGTGTANMVKLAKAAGVRVLEVR